MSLKWATTSHLPFVSTHTSYCSQRAIVQEYRMPAIIPGHRRKGLRPRAPLARNGARSALTPARLRTDSVESSPRSLALQIEIGLAVQWTVLVSYEERVGPGRV